MMKSSWGKRVMRAARTENETKNRSRGTEPAEQDTQGLKIVAEGKDPCVDIVALHGLNGHRDRTWTAANGVHWLRDLLPNDIPNARVFCWGYNANTHGKQVSCQYLYDHSRTLVSDLCLERELTETTKRPIIFVAHSLGGIIVKSALIHSDAAREGSLNEHRSIKTSTYGIFFMGTPHQGGNGIPLGKLLVNMASVFVAADDRLIKHLDQDSEWLQQQLAQYGPISSDFVTKYAFEEYETPTMLGKSLMVVPRASAVVPGATNAEPIAIHANHTNMVRFESKGDSGYKTVSGHLQLMVRRAGDVVAPRWEEEVRMRAARTSQEDCFSIVFSLAEVAETQHFVSRQQELVEMRTFLCREDGDKDRKAVVLHGLGGIGKTQLAVAYSKKYKADYSAVFWLNIKDEDTVKQSYARMATRIRQHCSATNQLSSITDTSSLEDIVAAVKQWLDHPKNTRWLMVFDNYDNPKLPDTPNSTAVDIKQFLPNTYHGSIIVTTRSSRVALGHPIQIRKLEDVRDSIQILCDASRRKDTLNDPGATAVAKELDGLPLALATAGAYLYQVAVSFQDYLRLYRASWLKLQQTTPELSSYEDRKLYTTWYLSYDHIKAQNELSARLLKLWAYFDSQDLWFELLREQSSEGPEWFARLTEDEFSFHDAMRVLCNHGLAEAVMPSEMKEIESRGYSMHSCVHQWTIHVLNQEWSEEMARLSLYCVSSHIPDGDFKGFWVTQRRLMQHASRCYLFVQANSYEEQEGLMAALYILGNLYLTIAKLEEAEKIFDRAFRGAQNILVMGHELTLNIMKSLGVLYRDQGKLMKAEKLLKQALIGLENVHDPNHPSTLHALYCLGILYRRLGKYGDAEKMYQRVLQGYDMVLKPGQMMMPTHTANSLGVLYSDQGRLDKAEGMYLQALNSFKEALGENHASTLGVINNLGLLYARQRKFSLAEEMYKQALLGKETSLGPDHTSTLATVNNLGMLCGACGRLNEAEEMLLRALRGKENALGPDHSSTLNTVNNLGNLYIAQGRFVEAEEAYLRALRGKDKALGPDHTSTLNAVHNLTTIYQIMGKESEAQQLHARFPKYCLIAERMSYDTL